MPEAVTRLNVALEGRYRIERELGEGGMATVYLADDLKHERKVALKVLKPELAAVVGAERFLAEIKTTANLQHPHILPLFDSGEADSFLFYVMPYVEGESLREKLDREKQLGVDEALALTAKLCDALDYAHSEGVIHRDIKPANILLSKRGEPLVADFGIALAVAHAGGGRITETGLSLGTPHYMSPEQATGDSEVDPRSDVYALACVVYEMLAGEPPFSATTTPAVLAKILTMDAPSITMVRRTVPGNVSAAVAKALEKLPADRFPTVSDFSAALTDPAFTYAARARGTSHGGALDPAMGGTTGGSSRTASWIRDTRSVAALSIALLTSSLAAWGWLQPKPPALDGTPTRLELPGLEVGTAAISPGGDWFVARDGASDLLLARAANDTEWRALPNTNGALYPTFSPDGQWVAYQVAGGIFKVPLGGGPALPVAAAGVRPTWAESDEIVFVNRRGDIFRVGASGGEPETLLTADTLEAQWARLLPGGMAVVFSTSADGDALDARILVLDIESGEVRELVSSGNDPRYVSTGHIVYGHGGQALMGVPFDLRTLRTTGSPVTLVPDVAVLANGFALYDVSATGTLVYADFEATTGASPLVWADLMGNMEEIPIQAGAASHPKISPDGGSIAYDADGTIWIHDIALRRDRQFTFEGTNSFPIWSADGRSLYFLSDRPGTNGLDGFRKAVDGGSPAEQLWTGERERALTSASPDGRWLVLRLGEFGNVSDGDIAVFDLESDTATSPTGYLMSDQTEGEGMLSPDGRWLAYWYSTAPLRGDVLVRGFPEPSGPWRISGDDLGREPTWAPDGSALYYTPNNGDGLRRVEVETSQTFAVGASSVLFTNVRMAGGDGTPLDIHPNGDRFVVARGANSTGGRVLVVTNWFTELRERMGEGS